MQGLLCKCFLRICQDLLVYFPFDYFALAVSIILTVPFMRRLDHSLPWESSEIIIYLIKVCLSDWIERSPDRFKLFSRCRGLYLVRDTEGLYMAWMLKSFPDPPRHYHNPMRSTLSNLLVFQLT